MTPITRPRGPLPARVYWTRRLLVLVVALALVYGVARLLGGDVPGGEGPSASPVAADPASSSAASTPATSPFPTSPSAASPSAAGPSAAGPSPTVSGSGAASPTALATPSGDCQDSDVVVVPSVASPAYAARPVVLTLAVTTKTAAACSWAVSSDSLVVKVTSGDERFWSTQDCEDAVPEQSVVVRKDTPTTVSVAWNGLASDAECSRTTSWSEPGYYDVTAAAFGAEPSTVQFRLFKPVRATITASPSPAGRAERKRQR